MYIPVNERLLPGVYCPIFDPMASWSLSPCMFLVASFYQQGEEHPCPKNTHVWFKGGFSAGVLGESAPFLLLVTRTSSTSSSDGCHPPTFLLVYMTPGVDNIVTCTFAHNITCNFRHLLVAWKSTGQVQVQYLLLLMLLCLRTTFFLQTHTLCTNLH